MDNCIKEAVNLSGHLLVRVSDRSIGLLLLVPNGGKIAPQPFALTRILMCNTAAHGKESHARRMPASEMCTDT